MKEFIDKINNKKNIEIFDFNIYKTIKTDNKISPLIIYILEKAIDKYNNNSINNGIETAGIGYISGVTSDEKDNFIKYFSSEKALLFFASFPEKFIHDFWKNHPLLSDLLGVNPVKTLLTSKFRLGKNILNEKKINKSIRRNQSSKLIYININADNNNINESFAFSDGNKILNKSNNDEQNTISFKPNALNFMLLGIRKYINLPRIIYYPIVKYINYEEVDNVFIIEEIEENFDGFYFNFKAIDIDKLNKRKNKKINYIGEFYKNIDGFKLNKNDIVFIETIFEFESKKNKTKIFLMRIIKFIY